MGDWLIAQRGRVINVGRLYGEFRSWLQSSGTTAVEALYELDRYADAYEKAPRPYGRGDSQGTRVIPTNQSSQRYGGNSCAPVASDSTRRGPATTRERVSVSGHRVLRHSAYGD